MDTCRLRAWRRPDHSVEVPVWQNIYDHAGLSESERAANTARWGQPLPLQPELCLMAVSGRLQEMASGLQYPSADYPALIAQLAELEAATAGGAPSTAALWPDPPAAGLLTNATSSHQPCFSGDAEAGR